MEQIGLLEYMNSKAVANQTFSVGADKFQEGKTVIDLTKVKTSETSFTDDSGKTKPQWIWEVEGKRYFAGSQIMEGLRKVLADAKEKKETIKEIEVIRNGSGKGTKYVVCKH